MAVLEALARNLPNADHADRPPPPSCLPTCVIDPSRDFDGPGDVLIATA